MSLFEFFPAVFSIKVTQPDIWSRVEMQLALNNCSLWSCHFCAPCKNHCVRFKRWDKTTSVVTFGILACYMGVSKNRGTPKSSILIGVFHYKPSILGYPYFWKHPYIQMHTLSIPPSCLSLCLSLQSQGQWLQICLPPSKARNAETCRKSSELPFLLSYLDPQNMADFAQTLLVAAWWFRNLGKSLVMHRGP